LSVEVGESGSADPPVGERRVNQDFIAKALASEVVDQTEGRDRRMSNLGPTVEPL
jgi:hypothetical protein